MTRMATAFLISLGLAAAAHADECRTWVDKTHPVTMEACSYTNGGSGYYKITNNADKAATVCWNVVFNDDKKSKGCNLNLGPKESTQGSCFSCGRKNAGAREVVLESYKPK